MTGGQRAALKPGTDRVSDKLSTHVDAVGDRPVRRVKPDRVTTIRQHDVVFGIVASIAVPPRSHRGPNHFASARIRMSNCSWSRTGGSPSLPAVTDEYQRVGHPASDGARAQETRPRVVRLESWAERLVGAGVPAGRVRGRRSQRRGPSAGGDHQPGWRRQAPPVQLRRIWRGDCRRSPQVRGAIPPKAGGWRGRRRTRPSATASSGKPKGALI